jgi:hypothetical protein
VLDQGRFRSYEKLQKELADNVRRSSMNSTLAEKDKIINMMGSLKTRKVISQAIKKKRR